MSHTPQTRDRTTPSVRGAATSPPAALAERFPDIEFVPRAGGGTKSHVRGGLDVWEYVFIASAFNWDVAETARHLSEPPERVYAALDYYHAFPDEVDARLERMRQAETDPATFFPRATIVDV